MPAKDQIGTAAFRLSLPADIPAILGDFHAFHVPAAWPGLLRKVWQREWSTSDETKALPIGHVNMALRALAPEVLHATSWRLNPDDADTWLYARQPVNSRLLKRIMQAHLQEYLGSPDKYPQLRDAVNALNVDAHADDWSPADTTQYKITTGLGGAALVPPVLYRLIPEAVAERVARLGKYDGELSFLQVPSQDGAELMSWPPTELADSRSKDKDAVWRYSARIAITLRTVPFDPVPRLHLSVGIRRWVPTLPSIPRKSVSVYLLPPNDPTAHNGASRFAMAALIRASEPHRFAWRGNGPTEILGRLSAMSDFPDPDTLAADPGAYLSPSSGFQAAVLHHTQMDAHAVETGLMPEERRRVLEWAAQAIPDGFEPGLVLRPTRTVSNPSRAYVSRKPIPKEPRPPKEPKEPTPDAIATYDAELTDHREKHAEWTQRVAESKAQNDENDAENARRNRELLARGMAGSELRIDVLTDTDRVRDALAAAAGKWLGLTPSHDDSADGHVVFRSNEVTVRLINHQTGKLTSSLGGEQPPRRREAFEKAVDERATLVQTFLEKQQFATELVLVEIASPKHFRYGKQRADPYDAIRQGAARAKRVTQFITTGGKDKHLDHRAEAAWADGIRSLGISLVPPHSAELAIPTALDQIAFWLVRRNTSQSVTKPVYLPLAVLIRPETPRVQARTPETITTSPETGGWLPYNLALCELACAPPRDREMASADRQREELANFVRLTLHQQRGRPTLMLVEASSLRYRWHWLTDEGLEPDRISTGDPKTMALSTFDKHLRVVRVRADANRDETPMWWALDSAKPNELAGYAKGLWEPHDATSENRVFLSTADKNSNLNRAMLETCG